MHDFSFKPRLISREDYLAEQAGSSPKSEFLFGAAYRMAEEGKKHQTIAANLRSCLRPYLQPFSPPAHIHIPDDDAFYYPDIVVFRQPPYTTDVDQSNTGKPSLIIEVVSPETTSIDRREKGPAYRKIPALQEYVLVTQDERSVEIYRRQGDIGWSYLAFTDDETVEFASVGLSLPMAAIYANT